MMEYPIYDCEQPDPPSLEVIAIECLFIFLLVMGVSTLWG